MKIETGIEIKGYPVEFEKESDRTEAMKAYIDRLKKESDENVG